MGDLQTWTQIETLTSAEIYNYLVFKYGSIIWEDYNKATITALISMWHNANKYRFDTLAATIAQEYNPIENYDRREDLQSTRTPNLTETTTHNTTVAQSGTTARSYSHDSNVSETVKEETSSNDFDTRTITENGSSTNYVVPYDQTVDFEKDRTATQSDTSYGGGISSSGDRDSTVTRAVDDTDTETITHGRQDKTTGTEATASTGNEKVVQTNHIHGNIGVTTVADMLESERERTANFVLLDVYLRELISNFSVGIFKEEF